MSECEKKSIYFNYYIGNNVGHDGHIRKYARPLRILLASADGSTFNISLYLDIVLCAFAPQKEIYIESLRASRISRHGNNGIHHGGVLLYLYAGNVDLNGGHSYVHRPDIRYDILGALLWRKIFPT